jgi:hypothetical protein
MDKNERWRTSARFRETCACTALVPGAHCAFIPRLLQAPLQLSILIFFAVVSSSSGYGRSVTKLSARLPIAN